MASALPDLLGRQLLGELPLGGFAPGRAGQCGQERGSTRLDKAEIGGDLLI